jgi:hypothetical protein
VTHRFLRRGRFLGTVLLVLEVPAECDRGIGNFIGSQPMTLIDQLFYRNAIERNRSGIGELERTFDRLTMLLKAGRVRIVFFAPSWDTSTMECPL